MSAEASREQLLDYIKKAKLKIKKLESELNESQTKVTSLQEAVSLHGDDHEKSLSEVAVAAGEDDALTSGWNMVSGFMSGVVNEVQSVVKDEEDENNNSMSSTRTGMSSQKTEEDHSALLADVQEKEMEIEQLRQTIAALEQSFAEQDKEKSVEIECHLEVIEAMKFEISSLMDIETQRLEIENSSEKEKEQKKEKAATSAEVQTAVATAVLAAEAAWKKTTAAQAENNQKEYQERLDEKDKALEANRLKLSQFNSIVQVSKPLQSVDIWLYLYIAAISVSVEWYIRDSYDLLPSSIILLQQQTRIAHNLY